MRIYSDLDRVCPEVTYFLVLREPLLRAASNVQFRSRVEATPPLEQWRRYEHWHNRQTKYLAGSQDVDRALKLLREKRVIVGFAEEFDEFLVTLKLATNHPALDIRYEPANVAPKDTIKKDLLENPTSRALLEETNRADLELYDRVRREIYPEQCARFPELAAEVARFRRQNRAPRRSARELANRAKRNVIYKPLWRFWRSRRR